MSGLASRMIWSTFSVAWILVVTACSCRKNSASNEMPRLSGGSCCDSLKACSESLVLRTAFMKSPLLQCYARPVDGAAPGLQLEFLACTQPPDVVDYVGAEGLRLVEALDLRHDQLGFGRLRMRDEDRE